MATQTKLDKDLIKAGVSEPLHQKILIDALPCGEETAKACFEDGANIQINAPRALMMCFWKGMVTGFALLEKAQKEGAK